MGSELGDALARARAMKRKSLRTIAEPAAISPTYLQKLERGDVRDPSPNVLYRLSQELDLPYDELMRLAGYVVPALDLAHGRRRVRHALVAEPLTPDEEAALTSYLGYLRSQKSRDQT
jgi:HTH-type transcriptional regulator, competence development regulator